MLQERLVNFRDPLEYRPIRRDVLAQTDEGTNYIDTHLHGACTSQHVCSHECAVFREGPWTKSRVSMFLGTGHSL